MLRDETAVDEDDGIPIDAAKFKPHLFVTVAATNISAALIPRGIDGQIAVAGIGIPTGPVERIRIPLRRLCSGKTTLAGSQRADRSTG